MKKKIKLSNLPKLKQDNIKAILGNPLFDSLVEKILDRKRMEPKTAAAVIIDKLGAMQLKAAGDEEFL